MKSLKLWEIIVLVVCIVLLITGIGLATWSVIRWLAPVQPVSTPLSTSSADQDWLKIQLAGKIVVGLSADYPPFEYYNPQYEIDGFDPALMIEIARKLGLEIEFIDFAFDGLGDALLLGQIDAAISAISVTPERQAQVDFSTVYYVGSDAILQKIASGIGPITSLDQIAPYKVGVQSKSVYETLIQRNLVNTLRMSQENLLPYPRIDAAIADLQAGLIDLVMLDQQAAESFVSLGGVEIVGSGLNQQLYAIAVRKGAKEFLDKINQALVELNNEGKVRELANLYLNLAPNQVLPTPPPTPTPVPNPTPTPVPPPASCVDGMAYVSDLNLDDNNMNNPPVMNPGQNFTKGWRIRNSGTCTWDNRYFLGFVYGNTPASSMGGRPTAILGLVPPGAVYDIFVEMTAPLQPGTYQGFWNMINPQGKAFGQKVWVGIRVNASPTATPLPTQTPSQNMLFMADRTVINAGEGISFFWQVVGARQVYFYIQGQDFLAFPVPSEGTRVEYPSRTVVYELTAIYQDGTMETRQIQILVNQPPANAPFIRKFSVFPTDVIYQGQCVDIQWIIDGSVTRVRLLRNEGELWGSAPQTGNFRDCPPGTGTVVYRLEATGPGGTSTQSDSIQVLAQPSTPMPTPTTAPLPPVIEYFSVNPQEVQVGGCIILSWRIGGGANRALLSRDGSVILDNAPLSGEAQDCLQRTGQVTYKMVAYNPQNQIAEANASVNVIAPTVYNSMPGSFWDLRVYVASGRQPWNTRIVSYPGYLVEH
jgi:polar amino acid transport system substrate-binding protein